MAQMKKPAPKKIVAPRKPTTGVKKPMPKIEGAKPGVKKNMSLTGPAAVKAKKTSVKPEGPSNYKPNKILKKPLTLDEARKYNKLPKDTLFTLPKGAEKLSVEEKKQMQARRILDRKRTLARGANIIRRKTLGK